MDSPPTSSRPLLFLVPDTFGSHLRDGNGRVWLDQAGLAGNGLQRLAAGKSDITTEGVIAALYGPLVTELESVGEVEAFDYDWRGSARLAAKGLALLVRNALDTGQGTIHFVAHGAGGLVVLALLADDRELELALRARGSRVVLLGTPVSGCWDMVRLLAGDHPLARQLARLADAKDESAAIVRVVAGWPGVLEQLPIDEFIDTQSPGAVLGSTPSRAGSSQQSKLAWVGNVLVARTVLDDARAFGAWLRASLAPADEQGVKVDRVPVFAIAGVGVPTAADVEGSALAETVSASIEGGTSTDGSILTRLRFLYSASGDGRVLAEHAVPSGAQAFYANASHAELISHPQLAKACLELLLSGKSAALTPVAPADTGPPAQAKGESLPDNLTTVDLAEAATSALARTSAIIFPLRVSVTHGHLRQARNPVMVGHYRGDGLVSAEEVLDAALDGSLRRRFDLGMYPGPEGTVDIVRRPDRHPPGAIVIGLGDVGHLTPIVLRRLVAGAVLRFALAVADDPVGGAGWRKAGFSALLLGSGGGASMDVSESVQAIVCAALDANRQLRQTRQWDRVRIDHVEFVELFEDVAAQAAHTVAMLPQQLADSLANDEAIAAATTLDALPGGLFHRDSDPSRSGWWRRIQIKAQPAGGAQPGTQNADALVLQFSAVGDLARLEVDSTVQNQSQVLRLVDAAMTDPKSDLKLSNTLYELLVPLGIKSRIRQGGDLLLQLDREGARYPFEAMAERVADRLEPLVIRYGLLRQLEATQYRKDALSASGLDILIVGAPLNVLPTLIGARREAVHVDQLARQFGWTPNLLVEKDGRSILKELFARDYRILHFAAHGCFDENPLKSGIIIDKDDYLTAAHVESLPLVPELVFLNCCHVGRLDQGRTPNTPFPQLAASIAEGFIRAGARAVIAAGWAVEDEAALTFATTFYQRFLSGETFGEAVREARKMVYKDHADTNTWGAYQCYGDSDFRLRIAQGADEDARRQDAVSRGELISQLRTLAARAGGAGGDTLAKLTRRYQEMRRQLFDSWKDGEVLAEFAAAAAELGNFDDAIALYREAIGAAKALVPLRAVEQLANILGRSAPALIGVAGASGGQADKLLAEANGWLDWMDLKLAATKERNALRGSLYKRWSLIATSAEERQKRLTRACRAYSDARNLANDKESYQVLNWVALRLLLEGRRAQKELKSVVEHELERARKTERGAREPDFWQRVAIPDALLHLALCDQTITRDDRLQEIARAYEYALATGPTAREIASVRDHVEFLAAMVPLCWKQPDPAIGAALLRIARKLAH